MKLPVLTPRLKTAADLCGEGDIIADIGSDHAYLPVYLLLTGKYKRAVITDVNAGPLKNAGKTAAEYGVSDLCEFRLGNGLDVISPYETDKVIIAGMGGELIMDIIKGGPLQNKYILQPMSLEHRLREYLYNYGFVIEKEKLAAEKRRIYTVLEVYNDPCRAFISDEVIYYTGEIYNHNDFSAAHDYMELKKAHITDAYNGLRKAGKKDEAEKYKALLKGIDSYEKSFGNI